MTSARADAYKKEISGLRRKGCTNEYIVSYYEINGFDEEFLESLRVYLNAPQK